MNILTRIRLFTPIQSACQNPSNPPSVINALNPTLNSKFPNCHEIIFSITGDSMISDIDEKTFPENSPLSWSIRRLHASLLTTFLTEMA